MCLQAVTNTNIARSATGDLSVPKMSFLIKLPIMIIRSFRSMNFRSRRKWAGRCAERLAYSQRRFHYLEFLSLGHDMAFQHRVATIASSQTHLIVSLFAASTCKAPSLLQGLLGCSFLGRSNELAIFDLPSTLLQLLPFPLHRNSDQLSRRPRILLAVMSAFVRPR